MNTLASSRHVCWKSLPAVAALGFLHLAPLAHAQPQTQTQSAANGELTVVDGENLDIDALLEMAKAHMNSLRYEQAIALLEPLLQTAEPSGRERQLDTYLLLVESHVYRGNLSMAGTKQQQLWYEEARDLVRECLGVRELRHTRLEPPEKYPTEMLRFFQDVRLEVFGSFEIAILDPPDAEVTFGGEALPAASDGTRRAVNVPVGTHVLVIRRPGYEEITEDVKVDPAMVVTRSYALKRRRGVKWYATWIVAPAAAVVIAVVALAGDSDAQDLPGPPPVPDLQP